MDKHNKKNKKKVATCLITFAAVICIVLGVIEIKRDFIKINKAAKYSEKMLNLFLKTEKK